METPQLIDLIPDIPEEDFEYSDLLESFQMLNDFGYITNDEFRDFQNEHNAQQYLVKLLPDPIRQFRSDYIEFVKIENKSINDLLTSTDLKDHFPEAGEIFLTAEEKAFLSELTSIDGDIIILDNYKPKKDEISLVTRIIHYRLKLLGVYDQPINLPFGNWAYANAMDLLKNWLKSDDELKILSFTDDFINLGIHATKYRDRNKTLFDGVAYFSYNRTRSERKLHKYDDLLKDPGMTFLEQLKHDVTSTRFQNFHFEVLNGVVKKYNYTYPEFRKEIRQFSVQINNAKSSLEGTDNERKKARLKKRIDKLEKQKNRLQEQLKRLRDPNVDHHKLHYPERNYLYVDRIIQDRFNTFIIRLLQLIQWSGGLYSGKIDDSVGDMTYDSISNLVDMEKSIQPESDISLDKVLIFLGDGHWALNIYYFLEQLVVRDLKVQSNQISLGEIYDQFYQEDDDFEKYSEKERKHYRKERNATKRNFENELNSYAKKLEQDTKEERKIYKGYRRIIGFFRRIGKWVKRAIGKIKRFFRSLWEVIKSAISTIFKEIKEAIEKFARGIKLLFGKRIIQTQGSGESVLLTDMDFDFDLVTIVKGNLDTENYKAHIKKCFSYSEGLQFTLKMVGKVIKIATSISALGWIQLGLKLIGIIKDLINKKKEELSSQYSIPADLQSANQISLQF